MQWVRHRRRTLTSCCHALPQIVKDKRTKKTKGYGFVSFLDSLDYAKVGRGGAGAHQRTKEHDRSSCSSRVPHPPPSCPFRP